MFMFFPYNVSIWLKHLITPRSKANSNALVAQRIDASFFYFIKKNRMKLKGYSGKYLVLRGLLIRAFCNNTTSYIRFVP